MSKLEQIRLGHPLSQHGAIYNITSIDDLVEAAIELRACQLTANGELVTSDDEVKIRKEVEQQKRKHERLIYKFGLSKNIKTLIGSKTKKEAEHLGKLMTIKENDLFLATHNSAQVGFLCKSKFQEFIPEHLSVTHEDFEGTGARERKGFKKAFSLFNERKLVQVHLFEKEDLWHCFYFAYNDIEDTNDNHWKMGAHIHYVSHLWSNLKPIDIWNAFDDRKQKIPGIHIKFSPYSFSSKDEITSISILEHIFPTEKKLLKSASLPMAALLTRGKWIATYSFPNSGTRR